MTMDKAPAPSGHSRFTEAPELELFHQVFREHYPHLVRKLSSLLGDAAQAEDAAQEAFVRLYRSPPDRPEAVGAWLHRVAIRIAYDQLRKRSSQASLLEKEQQRIGWGEPVVSSGEDMAIQEWEKAVVRRVLQKLSERDRTALLMKEQGYSYEEIGRSLSVNPKTVGTLLSRATERFRKQYTEEESMLK